MPRSWLVNISMFILLIGAVATISDRPEEDVVPESEPRTENTIQQGNTKAGPLSDYAMLAMMLTSKDGGKLPVSGAASKHYLHSKAPVNAKLSSKSESMDLKDGLHVLFTVSNPSKKPLNILRWETPFENPKGLMTDLFVVRNQDGKFLPYIGPDMRRRPPDVATKADFIVVPAKGEKSVTVNLKGAYNFDKDGSYYIRIKQPKDGHVKYKEVMKTILRVKLTGTKDAKAKAPEGAIDEEVALMQTKAKAYASSSSTATISAKRHIVHHKCSTQQLDQIHQWETDVRKWIEAAKVCTTTKSACEGNTKLWFGNPTQSAFAFSVTKTIKNIDQRLSKSLYNCEPLKCTDSSFAYVYPTDTTQTVFLCPLVFTYSIESEKRQTIVHELSHFDFIGINEGNYGVVGERDLSYGEKNCQDLALTHSTSSMNNADNIGYYVRDIALKSDPSCIDQSSSCPTWAASYNCGSTYDGIGELRKHCCKSCSSASSPSSQRRGSSHSGCSPSFSALKSFVITMCLLVVCYLR